MMREVSLETLRNVNIRDPSHDKNLPMITEALIGLFLIKKYIGANKIKLYFKKSPCKIHNYKNIKVIYFTEQIVFLSL